MCDVFCICCRMLGSLILSVEVPAVGVFCILQPNAGQSDPLGGGAGCGSFQIPHQELHACEIWISYLSA